MIVRQPGLIGRADAGTDRTQLASRKDPIPTYTLPWSASPGLEQVRQVGLPRAGRSPIVPATRPPACTEETVGT
jgi:hypothetical protein